MKKRALMLAALMVGMVPLTASAVPIISGTSSSTTITGSLDPVDFFNMFQFTWGGGNFSTDGASTNHPGTTLDTMLFLFDGAGFLKASNDDIGGGNTKSALPDLAHSPLNLLAGTYYIAVSAYPAQPRTDPYDGSWLPNAGGAAGNYELSLDGVDYSTVTQVLPTPEPASLFLLGTGAVGLVARFRRRKEAV